jgi:filamentous hemagglutinin
MDKVLNNGAWKAMEKQLADALKAGKSVSVKVDVGYPAGGGLRPNQFNVTATIIENGIPVIKRFPFKQ